MALSAAAQSALNSYRDAVRSARAWEDRGSHGDGRLEEAQKAERQARARLIALIGG